MGLVGGVLAPALGTLLTVANWFTGRQEASLYLGRLSTTLFVLTIPLLALGAHCLDLLEAKAVTPSTSAATLFGENAPVSTRPALRRVGRHVNKGGVAAALLLLFTLPSASRAQQTIFNVPTTDVLDKGKVYAELDASLKPNNSEALSRFSSFVPRVVVGVGGRVEVGLNVTGNIQPGPDSTTLVPVVKYKLYDGGDNGWAIAGGDHLFIPVRHRAYDAGNYAYLEFSKTFKQTGTRLTAGGYDFTRNVVAGANRAGGQFGFEQPVGKTVTLAADWFTGKHAAGYFTPGAVFKVGKKTTAYAGYSIGNQNASQGNHFFLLELGYNFN
ncbi:MAG: hypothetical protein JOZ96_29680 [Acidobacteria bacterium]|nr:hypothetical protein [Acidobacteriota bacterium]